MNARFFLRFESNKKTFDSVITKELIILNMAEEKKQPKPRGGAREGAGRKSKGGDSGTHHVGFRCSEDVYQILQMVENKTEFIEKAIREKWKRFGWEMTDIT